MDHFKLFLWLSLLILRTNASVQRFTIEPQDQIALVNSRVILPCRVSDKVGILQWTKDDFGLGIDRNLSAWERYTMIGNQARGDYYLEIYPVTLEDDGKYQCQVFPGSDYEQEIRSNFATLTVMVAPEPPRIVQGMYLVAYEYLPIKLECISYGGRPAAEINWIDTNGYRLTRGINSTVQVLPDGKRFLIKSILTIIPTMADRNSTFTCQTQNAAERTPQSAQLKLEVRYPPHVTVAILSGPAANGYISEGADVRLGCHAQANPPVVAYQWFLNDKVLDKNFTTELILKNVTRKYHDAIVKCRVYNKHGRSEEGEILYITTAPQFRNKPQSVLADVGEIVTLCCDVVGSPPPNITWLLANSSKIVGHDANLTLRVDINNAGRYKCKAHVVGFPEIEAEATIFLKGLPSIISPRSQIGTEGNTVQVDCTAHSVPAPTEILWTYKHFVVQGEEYTILEEPLPEGIKSTLVIRNFQERHFGLYSCRVTNSYGSDVLEIHVNAGEKLAFTTVVNIAITVILIFAAVVLVISFYWYRQWQRKTFGNVDINIIENQLRDSNGNLNASAVRLEPKLNCTRSNLSPILKNGIQSDSHVKANKKLNGTFHKNTLYENTYVGMDSCELDNWPPVRNPNYDELQEPLILLSATESKKCFPPTVLSTISLGDVPSVVATDPRFDENSDLRNLKIGLPIQKKQKVLASCPPSSSPYKKGRYSKPRGLQTIYE